MIIVEKANIFIEGTPIDVRERLEQKDEGTIIQKAWDGSVTREQKRKIFRSMGVNNTIIDTLLVFL